MTPELAIRARRAAFNRALADRNLDAVAALLAPDVVLVAGTDSAVLAGRRSQLQAWKREFTADRTVYARTPQTIVASPIEPIAFEHGQWRAASVSDGGTVASGAYTAKWRHIGDDWLIEAELFLTLA